MQAPAAAVSPPSSPSPRASVRPPSGRWRPSGYAVLAASVLCYGVSVTGLVALIAAMAGLLPLGMLNLSSGSVPVAAAVDLLLVLLFGLQHSVMARPSYKRWSDRHLTPALERSVFVLASGLALIVVVAAWQPLHGGMAWSLDGWAALAAWAGFAFGWTYLLAATFAIDHFDLFGLRQAWFAAQGRAYEPVPFVEHWMYRFSRHPIMLGALIGLWCVPHMSVDQLALAIAMSLYIAVGLVFEERDLLRQWGRQYADYRARVGALWTLPR